jgi:hypothetical protein
MKSKLAKKKLEKRISFQIIPDSRESGKRQSITLLKNKKIKIESKNEAKSL